MTAPEIEAEHIPCPLRPTGVQTGKETP
jgi:hypothetical protein